MPLLLRLLLKILTKIATLVIMVLILAGVTRYGQRYFNKSMGLPEPEKPQFSSDETDLMSAVFKSALRLFSGSATRNQLAGELSDKLYAGRGDAKTMSELGIELVKPGGDPTAPDGGQGAANVPIPAGGAKLQAATGAPGAQPGAKAVPGAGGANSPAGNLPMQLLMPGGPSPTDRLAGAVRTDLLGRIWERLKARPLEQWLVPIVGLGMLLIHVIRRRKTSRADAFVLPDVTMQMPAETEVYEMKHAVRSLSGEEFELLVALIYQRQGYRISMPEGMSGGKGGDFTLLRKAERILVQCKKLAQDHKVPVERVRELHDALTEAKATRGMFVASCSFSWDARNFAKAKGITLISARTLDELLLAAKESPEEDLLTVANWAPKLMTKVQFTTPTCPACEAAMDLHSASATAVWVCSQRPDCRGRRSVRKYQKAPRAPKVEVPLEEAKV